MIEAVKAVLRVPVRSDLIAQCLQFGQPRFDSCKQASSELAATTKSRERIARDRLPRIVRVVRLGVHWIFASDCTMTGRVDGSARGLNPFKVLRVPCRVPDVARSGEVPS